MKNWKFIWPYMSSVKWTMLFATLLLMLESTAYFSITALQQRLIDDVLLNPQFSLSQAVEIVGWFTLAFIVQILLFTFGPHVVNKATSKVEGKIVDQFMDKVYQFPVEHLQKERTATYVHYISNDIDRVSHLAAYHFPRGFQHVYYCIIIMAMIGMASPLILLCITIVSMLYFYLGKLFAKRLHQVGKEVQETKSRLLVHIEEGISSTREVIAYHRMGWEEKVYRTYFGKYFDKVMQEGKLDNLKMIASEPLNWGVRILILAYGGYLVLENTLSIGMFIVIFQLGSQLVETFQLLFNYIMNLAGSTASVRRVREVMERESWPDGPFPLEGPVESLQFEEVQFHYANSERIVLDGITLSIPIGKKIAFVGASGGGKSTIAQLLIRFFEPVGGSITVNGRTLESWQRDDWMKRVTIVFQEPYLFPNTIRENVCMGLNDVTNDELYNACQIAQIHDYIMSLPQQYETVIGDRGITLSGGQRQRLAIARALLREPDILILDEATSSLDMATERALQAEVDRAREGKTTVVIAHRLSTVRNADLIHVLDRGKLVESGTHEKLLENDHVYRRLVYHEEQVLA